jgi:hypothetical protein
MASTSDPTATVGTECVERNRRSSQTLTVLVLIPFSILTAVALWYHGYWGIIEPHFHSFGAAQVLVDLTIALGLFLIWLWRDATAAGRNPWPWVLLTLVAGSFGPLIYLLVRNNASDTK